MDDRSSRTHKAKDWGGFIKTQNNSTAKEATLANAEMQATGEARVCAICFKHIRPNSFEKLLDNF